jgi:hypothetical protein
LKEDWGVESLLRRAVQNNASWCAAVCATHSIAVRSDDGILMTDSPAPRLYPDAMTVRPGAGALAIASALADRPFASVKDSYADVDLTPFGFRVLFEAEWFVFEPGLGSGRRLTTTDPNFNADFARWVDGWLEVNGPPCPLLASLAQDPRTALILAPDDGGAIGHAKAGVVGVTNAWGRDVTGVLAARWSGIPLVAYQPAPPSDSATLKPLRVWVRGAA